jgi:Tfp pilus assembly PilM family ATPase
MARLLALEWNGTEACVAVATSRGPRVVFEQAFSLELSSGQSEADLSEGEVGQRIAAALAARRIGRIDALVAVGRSDVELRRLSLPPAPDDELPEIVRFQATREFNVLDEDWPLDFLTIDEDPEQPRDVLAAAINPELVEKIQQTCRAAGLKAAGLILRPCAAASLLRRRLGGLGKVCLLVDLLADEADLTVMVDQKVVFLRHARLRGDPLVIPAASEALLSEVRRTIAAAQNQLGGRRVESIVLCGAGPQHTALAKSIAEQLAMPTELFDPFDGLELEGALQRGLPEHPGRFAPLLGMLWDQLDGTPHAFDFVNPRRRPEPPSRRNTYLLAGAAVTTVVLALFLFGLWQRHSLKADVVRYDKESKALDVEIEKVAKVEAAVGEIDLWLATDTVWLDKLRWLSEELPPAQETMLTQLTMSASAGQMNMTGLVRDVDVIDELVTGLPISSKKMGDAGSRGQYSLDFQASVSVNREQP